MPVTRRDILLSIRTRLEKTSSTSVAKGLKRISDAFARGQISVGKYNSALAAMGVATEKFGKRIKKYTAKIGQEDAKLVTDIDSNSTRFIRSIQKRKTALSEFQKQLQHVQGSGLGTSPLERKRFAGFNIATSPTKSRTGNALTGVNAVNLAAFLKKANFRKRDKLSLTPMGEIDLIKAKLVSGQLRRSPSQISPELLFGPQVDRGRISRMKGVTSGLGRGGTIRDAPLFAAGGLLPPSGFGEAGGRGRGGGGRAKGPGGTRRGFVSGHGFTSAPEFVALAGAGLIAKAAFGEAADFDKAMAAVAAATGAAEGEMSKLRETAISLSTESVFSSSQIAAGMLLLARAGLDTNGILVSMKPSLDLATGAGEEFGDVAKGVTDIISQFGLKIEDTSRVSDILAKVLINSKADIKDLIPSFVQGGAVAKTLGISLEEVAAIFDVFAASGLKGTAAGTALRNVLLGIELIQKKEVFEGLGLSAEDVSIKTQGLTKVLDNLKKVNLSTSESVDIFNRRGLVPFFTLIQEGKLDIDKTVASYHQLNKESQRLAEQTTMNVMDSLTKLKNSALAPLTNEFQRLKPAIKGTVDALADFAQTGVGAEIITIGTEIVALGAIIGTSIIAIKGIARMWGTVALAAGEAATAQAIAGGAGSIAAGGAASGTAGAIAGVTAATLMAKIKTFFTVARGPAAGATQLGKFLSVGVPILAAHAVYSWVSGEVEDVKTLQQDAEQFAKEGVLSTRLRATLAGQIEGAKDIPAQRALLTQFQAQKTGLVTTQLEDPEIQDLHKKRAMAEGKLAAAELDLKLKIEKENQQTFHTLTEPRQIGEARKNVETLSAEAESLRKVEQETDVVLITSINELESAINTLSLSLGKDAADPHKRTPSKEERIKTEKAEKKAAAEAKKITDKATKESAAKTKKITDAKIAADKAAADKIRNIWEGAFSSIEGSVADNFEAMTQSSEKFKASLKTLPNAIKGALVKAAAQETASAVMTPIKNMVFSQFSGLFGGGTPGGATGGAPGGAPGGGLFSSLSSIFGGGTAAGTAGGGGGAATGGGAGAAGLAGLPILGMLAAVAGGAGIGTAIGGRGSKGKNATSGGVGAGGAIVGGTLGFFLGGPLGAAVGAAGGAAAASIIAKGLGISGGASKKKLRHRRAKAASALMAQVEVDRQKERDRAATQLQQVFGGGLVTTEGAAEIGQLLSGGVSEAELQELEKGAGETPGALGGGIGGAGVGNNVTMNNQFIIRSGLDVNKIAQALGQQISQFTPAGSFGVP